MRMLRAWSLHGGVVRVRLREGCEKPIGSSVSQRKSDQVQNTYEIRAAAQASRVAGGMIDNRSRIAQQTGN